MTRRRCARCGATLGDWRIYSRFTRNYYCVDEKACGRRARRKQRVERVGA